MRKLVVAFTMLMAACLMPKGAVASEAELVMFSSKGCVYCVLFDRDVAPNYRWSTLSKRAPLRKIDMDRRGSGGYSLKSGITVTPTFVMFKRGREIGRILGYPGKRNFYRIVKHMLKVK